MNKQLSVNIAICDEYQGLLEHSQRALENWNEHRADVCSSRALGRETGDELLRLQAKFARAYAMLQHHTRHCPLCEMVAHIEGRDPEIHSEIYSESAHQYVV